MFKRPLVKPLLGAAALIALAAVQAFRRWRFEQEDLYRNVIPRADFRDLSEPSEGSAPPLKSQLWRYLPLALFLLGLAFIAYTTVGKELAKRPSFWPILMTGCGSWSLFTAARGFMRAPAQPFAARKAGAVAGGIIWERLVATGLPKPWARSKSSA